MSGKTFVEVTTSLDGFIAGPNQTLERPLGEGGERLHEWLYDLASFRERHGESGGEVNADSELLDETLRQTGAVVMGRRMFSGGDGSWEHDPNAGGWWGDDPPFRAPVFVLTSHPREPLVKQGGTTFTFVTDGTDAALEQARAAAGEKDVLFAGGAQTIQQFLNAGLVDELNIHVAPLLLGGGVRLFDGVAENVELERTRVIDSPKVTHLQFRVVR
jgi:dihydrofolate reductase